VCSPGYGWAFSVGHPVAGRAAGPGRRARCDGASGLGASEEWVRAGVKLGVAILTMGTRPKELGELLASVAAQTVPAARTVVVANGCRLPELPSWAETVELPDNLGATGGRNAALERLRDMDLVLDLDDDGLLVADDVIERICALYEADPRLGIVGFRIADETGMTQRRHVPRLRAGDPMRGGYVTGFLGGAHVLSSSMLEKAGD
jgi:Glycosyl transferase family 2